MAWTNENPNEETIKCVIVGDNNVGKTRLICSRAYRHEERHFSFKKYGGSHVPTVWAIDQYRNNEQVLDNARTEIDDVMVSLRLWDTFGDHDKNRKFAYGRADVAVVCFSVCDRKSMNNIKKFWLKELREHCKKIPVFIVACKTDLRFIDLAELNQNRSRWTKEIKRSDLIFPEESRKFAKELDCTYYESSVLMDYGVNDVFDNAIRAALMYRRGLYFWKSTLKRVKRPLMQEPLLPTKPKEPPLLPSSNEVRNNLSCLLFHDICCDAEIFCHDKVYNVHKVVLASLSDFFLNMFSPHHRSHTNNINLERRDQNYNGNVVFVVSLDQLNELDHAEHIPTTEGKAPPDLVDVLSSDKTLSESQEFYCHNETFNESNDSFKLPNSISTEVFDKIIELCYEGYAATSRRRMKNSPDHERLESEFLEALNLFQISVRGSEDVGKMLVVANERINRVKNLFLCKETLADVIFEVDDGFVPAHKAMLIAGCDVMGAMFSGKFCESFTNVVPLPGTLASSLRTVLEYIYIGSSSFSEKEIDFVDLIKLTNRLWLPEFMKQIEHHIIMQLKMTLSNLKEGESVPTCLCANFIDFLEVGQLHNAQVLVSWCMHFLCVYYNDVCRKCPKKIKVMCAENLSHISVRRWPPVWYIKDKDNYDKALRKRVERNDEYSCKNKNTTKSKSK